MGVPPFRDNNIDALQCENEQLKKELELTQREARLTQSTNRFDLAALVDAHVNKLLAFAIGVAAIITGDMEILILLLLL